MDPSTHKFHDDSTLVGEYGIITADNPVTRALVEVLLGGPEAISKASGNKDWRCYRALLVAALADLWD